MIEGEVFANRPPCCRRMAVLTGDTYFSVWAQRLSCLSKCGRYGSVYKEPNQNETTNPGEDVHWAVCFVRLAGIIVFDVAMAILAIHAEGFVANKFNALRILLSAVTRSAGNPFMGTIQ